MQEIVVSVASFALKYLGLILIHFSNTLYRSLSVYFTLSDLFKVFIQRDNREIFYYIVNF